MATSKDPSHDDAEPFGLPTSSERLGKIGEDADACPHEHAQKCSEGIRLLKEHQAKEKAMRERLDLNKRQNPFFGAPRSVNFAGKAMSALRAEAGTANLSNRTGEATSCSSKK